MAAGGAAMAAAMAAKSRDVEEETSELVKEGNLLKRGRGRGLIAMFLSKPWQDRRIKLYEGLKIQYCSDDSIKGEIVLNGAQVSAKEPGDADGRQFPFEITNPIGDALMLNAENEKERGEWIHVIKCVVNGTWKLEKRLAIIAGLIGCPKIKTNFNKSALEAQLQQSSYDTNRLEEVYYCEWLDQLIDRIRRFQSEDSGFCPAFNEVFTKHTIDIEFSSDISGYYECTLREGGLVITNKRGQVWTNLSELGSDLPACLGGDVPYIVKKSMRENQGKLSENLRRLQASLRRSSPCTFEAAWPVVGPELKKSNYNTDDYYGGIFYDQYIGQVADKVASFAGSDASFIEMFNAKFTTGKVVIHVGPSNMAGYNKCSFVSGDLVVTFKSGNLCTNMSEIGSDFPQIISEGISIPYLAQKSMQDGQAKLNETLRTLGGLLNKSDMCLEAEYALLGPEMKKSNYGEDRFADIFYEAYLQQLVDKIRQLVAEDSDFAEAMNDKFTTKKVVIDVGPSNQAGWNKCSFRGGDLVITIKSGGLWTNLGEMGDDIVKLL